MVKKVISGAQTGADRAALVMAKKAGISTGGWMPKGFLAQDGKHPEFAELFGIQEHKSAKYSPRTYANVRDSDGTLRFASEWNSPGERCTLNAIFQYKQPHFDVTRKFEAFFSPDPSDIVDWIIWKEIEVLNIAGNSEWTSPGITALVESYLRTLFGMLDE